MQESAIPVQDVYQEEKDYASIRKYLGMMYPEHFNNMSAVLRIMLRLYRMVWILLKPLLCKFGVRSTTQQFATDILCDSSTGSALVLPLTVH